MPISVRKRKTSSSELRISDEDRKPHERGARSNPEGIAEVDRRPWTAFEYVDYVAILKEITDRRARHDEVRRVLGVVGLTDLADRIGITLANLSVLKTNKARAVRFSTLEALCRELNCQPGDLLERTPEALPDDSD